MTWQITLALVLYVGWVGLHSWLGKKGFFRTLASLIVLDVLAFVGLFAAAYRPPDHGGAGALAILIGGGVLLIPAAVGAFAFWKHGTTRAL